MGMKYDGSKLVTRSRGKKGRIRPTSVMFGRRSLAGSTVSPLHTLDLSQLVTALEDRLEARVHINS